MNTGVTIGLDLGRRSRHQAVIVGGPGSGKARPLRVDSSAASLEQMLGAAGTPDGCRVVLEPTGMAWLPVSVCLVALGCEVIGVDTRSAHGFRQVLKHNVKSDRLDAEALARLPLANPDRVRPIALASAECLALDRLVRLRGQVVEERSREKLRLLAAVEGFSPALREEIGNAGGSIPADKSFLLAEFLDPQRTLAAGEAGLVKAIKRAKIKLADEDLPSRWVRAAELTASLFRKAPSTAAYPVDFDTAQFEVAFHLRRIAELDKHVADLEQRIAGAYERIDPDRVLETLPGIGPTIAPLLLAATGDIERFPNAKALASYFGLAPKKNQSGSSDRTGQHISKAGNRRVRHFLFLAADVARRSDPQLAAYYARKIAAGKHHNSVVTAIANKLVHRIYAVLKRIKTGDKGGYRFLDDDGTLLTPKDATRRTRARYPSKAQIRKASEGRSPATRKPGQPEGSPSRQPEPRPDADHVQEPVENIKAKPLDRT